MSDNRQRTPTERAAAEAASWGAWKLIAWIGGGTLALLVLGVSAFVLIVLFMGGGLPGSGSQVDAGTAASRPTEWIDDPAIVHRSLPNVVILAVMEQESRGQVFAQTYNCTWGPPLPKPCEDVYPGGLVKTRSEDAGLMQINSGGWPTPQDAAKWRALGIAADPFDPAKNIAAGVAELQADMQKYHYLEYALEAYNSGSGGPHSKDATYAQAVLGYIQQYEAEPTVAIWCTCGTVPQIGNASFPGYWEGPLTGPYWVVVSAAGPYGPKFSIPWAPGAPVCATESGRRVCAPGKPVMLTGNLLEPPSAVVQHGLWPGQSQFQRSPAAAPLWPGAIAWASELTDDRSNASASGPVNILWPGGHASQTDYNTLPAACVKKLQADFNASCGSDTSTPVSTSTSTSSSPEP